MRPGLRTLTLVVRNDPDHDVTATKRFDTGAGFGDGEGPGVGPGVGPGDGLGPGSGSGSGGVDPMRIELELAKPLPAKLDAVPVQL